MTFNMLVRNYDAHGKNISFFVGKQGLSLTPFYDLVNIEAIIKEINSRKTANTYSRDNSISQHFAMSIGEYEQGNSGNFDTPITAYMLADFADEFGISLARMQLLMSRMIKSVANAIDTAKSKALAQELSEEEVNHIDLCIAIINDAISEIDEQVKEITSYKGTL